MNKLLLFHTLKLKDSLRRVFGISGKKRGRLILFQAKICSSPDLSGRVYFCALHSPKFFGVKKFLNDEQTIF